MKIVSSNIQFSTEYRQRSFEQSQAAATFTQQRGGGTTVAGLSVTAESLQTAQREQRALLNSSDRRHTYSTSQIRQQGQQAAKQITTEKTVSSVLERFYSHSVRLSAFRLNTQAAGNADNNLAAKVESTQLAVGSYYEIASEQQLTFLARGEIATEDGRQINFEFYASADQRFRYQEASGTWASQVTRRADPLVIHLNGDINHLSSAAFEFDIDSDGDKETLAFAGSGSGFLVLDKNGDGKINNGSELFGPATGNGFQELAAYDEDGNGFIDAGDSVYEQLQVWTKDQNGKDQLISLKAADVAAIGTHNGVSPYTVKDHYNNELGQVQRTGIFVRESGQVGAIQQIDLTERDREAEQVLQNRFDRGEKQSALEAQLASSDVPPDKGNGDLAAMRNALERLKQETAAMLERQEDLAGLDREDEPKSFLAQIVDALEAARQKQQERRKEAQDSDE